MKFRIYTTLLIALIVIGASVLGDSAVANVEKSHQAKRTVAQGVSEPPEIRDEPEAASPKRLARNTVEIGTRGHRLSSDVTFDDSNGSTPQESATAQHPPRGYLGLIMFGSLLFVTAVYLRREKSA